MAKHQSQYNSFRFAYKTSLPGNIHACDQDVNAVFGRTKEIAKDLGLTVADIPLAHYEAIGKIVASFTKGLPAQKVGDNIVIPTRAIVSSSESSIRGYLQEIIDSGQIYAKAEVHSDHEYDMSATEDIEIPEDSEADISCLIASKPAETSVEINRLKSRASKS